MEDLTGSMLGKYQILEELGRGGMSVVYKAQDTVLHRLVAIKILAPHLAWEEKSLERFLHEARLAAGLDHPAIVTIHDMGNEGGWHYIVMEYLQGTTLASRIDEKGQLSAPEALQVLEQVAAALDYAHSQGLFHRDVKPSNIIIAPSGKVTLTDFGIAKALSDARLTATGTVVGTPAYMAPEQVTGGSLGPWTDIYSLGVVAYEMLAGRVPFDADTTAVILHKVAYEPVPPIVSVRPDMSGTVQEVLDAVLSKAPERRFPSATAFVTALSQALSGEPPEATLVIGQEAAMGSGAASASAPPPPSIPETALPVARPRRFPVWGWLGLGVVLVAAVTLLATQVLPFLAPPMLETPEPVPTPTQHTLNTPSPTTASATTATMLPSEVRARVIISNAKLRAGPGVAYEVVEELVAGDEVRVSAWVESASGDVWLLVGRPEGGSAWISVNAVELQGNLVVRQGSFDRQGKIGYPGA